MIDQRTIMMHEIIGYPVEIIDASDKSLIGVRGRTVDETMRTVRIQRANRNNNAEITVPKKHTVLKLTISADNEINLDCSKIIYRPEDRIKKLYHKKNLRRSK
jgi:ribonuclease P protein subunit POP4